MRMKGGERGGEGLKREGRREKLVCVCKESWMAKEKKMWKGARVFILFSIIGTVNVSNSIS
jgi:hypothetical protein